MKTVIYNTEKNEDNFFNYDYQYFKLMLTWIFLNAH